jgi:rhodanese-related sulfurtransferase
MPDPVTDEHVISVDELESLCRSDAPPILINTLPAAAHRAKHIPGSINVPVDDLDLVETIVPNKDDFIVVYCANNSCTASTTALETLQDMGYTNVRDFEGGYAAWRRAGHPLVGDNA